jgi:sulfoxide reductase heme-binding subunit YedZ
VRVTSPVDWYAARAAGIVAYVLLSSVVVLGLTLAGKERLTRWPRFAVEDVHRFGGLLVGSFIGLHVLTLALDSYVRFPLTSLFVPFASSFRPFWTALGVVAMELTVALAISNRYRSRLPHHVWRRFHYVTFAIWIAATAHGLGAGTDAHGAWVLLLYVPVICTVVALTVRRVLRSPQFLDPVKPALRPARLDAGGNQRSRT